MKRPGVATLLAALIAILVAGCQSIPQDGRYQTHGTGWDNFRG